MPLHHSSNGGGIKTVGKSQTVFFCDLTVIIHTDENKRAKRALGGLPEENIKGHSGANNREARAHNLNNFGRRPFDDVIYVMSY